jgi:hypothetical protein
MHVKGVAACSGADASARQPHWQLLAFAHDSRIACKVIVYSTSARLRMRTTVALLWSFLVSGCIVCPTHYRASAVMVGGNLASTDTPPLSTVVADALRPLGFTTSTVSPDPDGVIRYYLGGGFSFGNRIDVALDGNVHRISVFDYKSSRQTDITRRVQEAIERQVASVYGTTTVFNPPLHRVADCLGP